MGDHRYYTLAPQGTKLGALLFDTRLDRLYVARDPRTLPIGEITDRQGNGTDVILEKRWRLVRLAPHPQGEVRVGSGDYNYSAVAWSVAAIEPIGGLLGPQAKQLIEVAAATLEALGEWDSNENEVSRRYIDAINAQDLGLLGPVRAAEWAARYALRGVGADGYWWEGAFGCTHATEMLALAARDLIGSYPDWTTEAYTALTAPWRAAFRRPLHPDDPPVGEDS